ncbi:MAG TPA: response regulator transcription factor [Nevskiaceae bacterium]|nr:response regulator transcription factor [Nevskiaceae bacterium]
MAARASLLLAEDDAVFARTLGRALERRGFDVSIAHDAATAETQAASLYPRYAVVDLKLGDDSGLALIPVLRAGVPGIRILLLTGYASIATAVEAIKRGAYDYLAKPVDADTVVRALLGDEGDTAPRVDVPATPLALRRLEWEHIQRTLAECGGNVSEAARRLGMHRRTLQRRLYKRPVSERR